MPEPVLEAYIREVARLSPGPVVSYAWQGGEPTLAGLDFFRRAVELGVKVITEAQLSQFLNQHYNKNFNSYINGFRIDDAKKLLVNEADRNTLSIALAVGFNSYSAFHSAFRKTTGISPAEYRKKHVHSSGK